MDNKIRKVLSGSTRKTRVFFTRRYLFALAAILFTAVGATASLLLPMAYAGTPERGETVTSQSAVLEPVRQTNTHNIAPEIKNQNQNVWSEVERSFLNAPADDLPPEFGTFRLDKQALVALLGDAPHELNVPLGRSDIALKLPFPDGTLHTFRIQEAPVLEPSLADRFPEIKSYRALSIDDPGTTARFDLSPRGFHATILTPGKTVSILPADKTDETLYASYDGASLAMVEGEKFSCSVGEKNQSELLKSEILTMASPTPSPVTAVPINRKLKTYKIAISVTYEYFSDPNLGGNTLENTAANINTWINAVNAVYERELSIRLLAVIFRPNTNIHAIQMQSNDTYDDITQPYPPAPYNYTDRMHDAVRKELHTKIEPANYNLGHVFTKNSPGGVAGLGNVCDTSSRNNDGLGQRKGEGYTGLNAAAGNQNVLKVLLHEIGHQFGANHTFNGTACGGDAPLYPNRSAISSYEVGSGNTIMAYHGVCGTDNVVSSGDEDLRFHSHSFTQITDHVYNGIGQTCGEFADISNSPPTILLPENRTIPKFTPFELTAEGASDPDLGDINNLTYTWEQYQSGGTLFYQSFGAESTYNDLMDASSTTPTTRPIFRPMPVTISPTRIFPSLKYILNNSNDAPHLENNLITAEELPRIGRDLKFRVTVRDTLGGVSYKEMSVTVAGTAGPFRVTAPNTAVNWTGGSTQTVTWDKAGTDGNGINTTSVKILLSTDGGQTFPIVLSDSAANIGTASVFVPNNINTSTARIKIKPTENVFFDISDTNFSITPSSDSCPIINDIFPKTAAVVGSQVQITGANFNGVNSVVFSGGATATPIVSSDGKMITVIVPNGAQGGEIRVGKPGCGSAVSGRFTLCTSSAQTISVDDGSPNVPGQAGATSYLVNRLTPSSYPATLSEVKIYHRSVEGFPINKPITILSAAHPSGSTEIGGKVFNERAATVEAHDRYVTYQIEPITITSGDFIVGFRVNNPTGPNYAPNPVALDSTPSIRFRSYYSNDGIGWGDLDTLKLMIRASVFYNVTTPISISDDSKEANGFASQGKSYHVNRLTPTAYPATLSEVRIYHRSDAGFPTTKQITILSAANPTGSTNINNTKFNQRAASVTSTGTYYTYQVDPITIHSGDFIVGYSFDRAANESTNPVAVDTTSPDARRSYSSSNGTTFNLTLPTENYMIRAATSVSPCSNGACTYSVAMTSGSISGAGGSGTVSVITQAGCPWKASRNVTWIRMTSLGNLFEEAVSASGSGTATFAVDPNTDGRSRTGGVTVSGRVITVPQNPQNLRPDGEDPSEPEIFETQAVTFGQQALAPTSASVTIGGRVTAYGRAVPWARVSLRNAAGETRQAIVNAFGYYNFEEVSAGETYIVSIYSKPYNFAPQIISVFDNIQNLDFAAQ